MTAPSPIAVLVTGATGPAGLATARRMAADGARVAPVTSTAIAEGEVIRACLAPGRLHAVHGAGR